MRSIEKEEDVNRILGLAYTCVSVDSGRIPNGLVCFVFHELGIGSIEFSCLILLLARMAEEIEELHVVLRSGPIYCFHQRLSRQLAFVLKLAIFPKTYLEVLGIGCMRTPPTISAHSGRNATLHHLLKNDLDMR